MPAFKVDFMRNGGTYMILKAEGGLHSKDINRVQHTMLATVEVPGLLPLDLREIDFEVSLHYEITGKRMLSQCLKNDKLSAQEFYSLLLQIVVILDDSHQYMLSPYNFIINEDFIFVEEPLASAMLYLTYVPTRESVAGQERLGLSLLTLITRILSSVTVVEGSGIQRIVSFCGDELFSTSTLKTMLLDLLGGHRSEAIHIELVNGNGARREWSDSSVMIREYVQSPERPASIKSLDRQNSIKQQHDPVKAGGMNRRGNDKARSDLDLEQPSAGLWNTPVADTAADMDDDSELVKKNSKFTYYILGVVLAVAFCWKFLYLDAPSSWGLYTCIGITLVLAVALLLIRKGGFDMVTGSVSEVIGRISLRSSGDEDLDEGEPEDWKEPWNGGWVRQDITDSRKQDTNQNTFRQMPVWSEIMDLGQQRDEPEQSSALSNSRSSAQVQGRSMEQNRVSVGPENPSTAAEEPISQPATVLLSRMNAPSIIPSPTEAYRLERYGAEGEQENRPETITLKRGSFVIGRSEEVAGYVERAVGVSRAHVELMVREEGCSIKDLGSRNGTLLKGSLLPRIRNIH
ncbi:DUF6382 domain-containing protein [Paenibacillus sp. D2_2]|uniref:DUF6382 domain-containing protein n=1 Tax=Paenibacillus sp. D2_2 TaxID=3073092 RepID=UPI0028166270|nr:DUF6382 domain-containing protein [Paenibacillus sp. D2_2]WMT39936.1 DUF6382 domain-containing protein [Paenibacillus sp. D2_2]